MGRGSVAGCPSPVVRRRRWLLRSDGEGRSWAPSLDPTSLLSGWLLLLSQYAKGLETYSFHGCLYMMSSNWHSSYTFGTQGLREPGCYERASAMFVDDNEEVSTCKCFSRRRERLLALLHLFVCP